MSSFKVNEPFQYDGRQDMSSLITWIQSFERYARLTEMPQHLVVDIAGSYLKDQALVWFNQLGSQTFNMNWDCFKEIIIERFAFPTHEDNVLRKWDSLIQKRSVSDYIKEFNNVRATMPDCLKHEERDMHHFIKGLKLITQTEIEIRCPQSLKHAMVMANKFDKIFSSKFNNPSFGIRFNQNNSKFAPHSQRLNEPTPMQLDSIPGNRNFKKLSPQDKNQRISNGTCFKCGQKGHYASKCLKESSQ